MTTNQILNTVYAVVSPWSNDQTYIASGFFDCWEWLQNKPGTAKIGIYATGGIPRNNFPQGSNLTRREDAHFKVVISRGRGAQQNRSDNLTVGSGGGRPLFDLLDELKIKVMNVLFDPNTTERPHEYLGWGEFEKVPGVNIDAFEIRFSLGNQLPMPSAVPSGGQPV